MVVFCLRIAVGCALAGLLGCASAKNREFLVPPDLPPGGAAAWAEIRVSAGATSTDSLRVTLDEAVALALANRPAMHAASDRVLAAEGARRQAGAWTNPEAFVEAEGFGGEQAGLNPAEVTLGLEGGIDVFGRASARVRTAEAALHMEQASREAARRELEAEVRRAFHEMLAARERVAISEVVLDVSREMRDAVQSEIEAGKTATIRGLQTETNLDTARLQSEAAQTRLDLARTRLAQLLSGNPLEPRPVVAAGELRGSLPVRDADALAAALEHHPALVRELWTAELQNRRGSATARERLPDLRVALGYRQFRRTDENDWVGGLSVELPLLNRKEGALREARMLESASRHEAREIALRLAEDLGRALAAARAAARLLESFDSDVIPRAQEANRLAHLGYSEGKFGYLDLLNAQEALVRSLAQRARALIDLDGTLTELEILLGETLQTPQELED